ncbi:hypothetical protein FH972_024530 [Carpinus fangiana]|uniref:Uncharacterized protein n=1 Tax=Carpinus fangiana TaxID=176857 RepID=A0A5N6KYQ8_9ROSI|nr:hypothetical protein FH972_024530 [Carpinus fangiana]
MKFTGARVGLLATSITGAAAQSTASDHGYIYYSTSLFVPVEYPLNTFSASLAGNDLTATTFVFDCATATSCGPVTVIQGSSTARFIEADQPITTVWDCPSYGRVTNNDYTASCIVTSTSSGSSLPGASTSVYSAAAFPTYKVLITAGTATPNYALSTAAGTPTEATSLPRVTPSNYYTGPPVTGGMGIGTYEGSQISSIASSTDTPITSSPSATPTDATSAGGYGIGSFEASQISSAAASADGQTTPSVVVTVVTTTPSDAGSAPPQSTAIITTQPTQEPASSTTTTSPPMTQATGAASSFGVGSLGRFVLPLALWYL